MKIQCNYIQNHYIQNNYRKDCQKPSFQGIMHVDRDNRCVLDSWFYRDYDTLKLVTDDVRLNFPDGAEILDYACSIGEETISAKSMLPESKYTVIGYDISPDALRLAKRGVYSLFTNWFDSYLMPQDNSLRGFLSRCMEDKKELKDELRARFHGMMREIPAVPQFSDINNKNTYLQLKERSKNFTEKFYVVRDEFKDDIKIERGNIVNIGKHKSDKPVAAVFFRNAIYHLCENNINEVISFNSPIGKIFNKNLIMNCLVREISSVLSENGLFVIGNHIKEHLFWADESTLPQNKTHFSLTPFFNPYSTSNVMHSDLECYKHSPLSQALVKHGFVPYGFSKAEAFGKMVEVPVVWKKIRL